MIDAIGNKISKGDLVCVSRDLAQELVYTVVDLSEGGLATAEGLTPGTITIIAQVPVNTQVPLLAFKCLRDPNATTKSFLDFIPEGARRQ